MGGNALKTTTTRRYDKSEYEALVEIVLGKLQNYPLFAGRRMEAVKAYENKESFGDLDLLIESDGLPHTVWFAVVDLFRPNEIVRNGGVTSFDVNNFQVDLLMTPSKVYDMTAGYYAYNDLGNLIGRIAHNMGLSYGHGGLVYNVFSKNKDSTKLDSVVLTLDPLEAMSFLGYDVQRWKRGFATVEDIFEFCASSPYFHASFYDLEKRTYKARVRDAKRPTYQKFLSWLSLHDYPVGDATEGFRETHLMRARSVFPHFDQDVAQVYTNEQILVDSKRNLNAEIIARVLEIPIQNVGLWFRTFKKEWPSEHDYHVWTSNAESKDIEATVLGKKDMELPGPSIWSTENVREWTGLKGKDLHELCTRFPQQWMDASAFQDWVQTQNAESLKLELFKHTDVFFKTSSNACTHSL